MSAPLACLPPELYSAIISCIPPDVHQKTVLSLTRAIARSPVPVYHLFDYGVHLKHADQVFALFRCLRLKSHYIAWIHEFSLECWSVDADIVINLLALIPHLTTLRLGLDMISLRFRPYVQVATYYQFLKGAYFDSTLTAFSRWPSMPLLALSIVQDPLEASIAPIKFAQPLVFFRLDPLSTLAQAPLLTCLRHLRLRIPSRQAARFLYTISHALPHLELLDMSTCNVLEADVEGLLGRFERLRALVLDDCPIVSQRIEGPDGEPPSQWAALGKTMALAGVKHAKEREKKLKAWREAQIAALEAAQGPPPEQEPAPRRPRPGRRGLATATISLRSSPPHDIPPPVTRVKVEPHRNAKKRIVPPQTQKIRILPSLPHIVSIATTTTLSIAPERHEGIRAEFERGWAEGIAQLSAIRRRLKSSWGNGVRIVSFENASASEDEEDGLSGLRDVKDETAFILGPVASASGSTEMPRVDLGKCPVLCLAGHGRNDNHAEGCGHQVGWQVWGDEL
ncbi:hypothetical protein B0H21DRAFT_720822 [Amylocystis lapponica]|nr:hypothetical protein B0H21DRAFT_720822 [Amylocystis lapponica]